MYIFTAIEKREKNNTVGKIHNFYNSKESSFQDVFFVLLIFFFYIIELNSFCCFCCYCKIWDEPFYGLFLVDTSCRSGLGERAGRFLFLLLLTIRKRQLKVLEHTKKKKGLENIIQDILKMR